MQQLTTIRHISTRDTQNQVHDKLQYHKNFAKTYSYHNWYRNHNTRSKNFEKYAASKGGRFSEKTLTSLENYTLVTQSLLLMFFGCLKHVALTLNAFRCPFPWGSQPYLIHGALGQPKSTIQSASQLVSQFCGLTSMNNRHTDRHTDHAILFVAEGAHLMH